LEQTPGGCTEAQGRPLEPGGCTKIHSISGLLSANTGLVTTRPFRSLRHSNSGAGRSGGASIPKPAEITLPHHKVLFVDKLPEFKGGGREVSNCP
jgi:magnesium chelatase family protein